MLVVRAAGLAAVFLLLCVATVLLVGDRQFLRPLFGLLGLSAAVGALALIVEGVLRLIRAVRARRGRARRRLPGP
jgi:hypothetical protein